jgi:hypothetical protein
MCTQKRLKGKFLPSFANASPIIRCLTYEVKEGSYSE